MQTDDESNPKTWLELPDSEDLRERALTALRSGRFHLADELIANDEVGLANLVENLRIYQTELEIQNEELVRSQKRAEQALERFTALFQTSPIAELVVDRHGLIIEANPAAKDLFALRDLRAHHHFLLRLVDASHRGSVLGLVDDLVKQEAHEGARQELRLNTTEGESFIADLHAALLPETQTGEARLICAVIDRTEVVEQHRKLRQAYDQLAASEEAYHVLAEYSPDWDYWMDSDGCFRHISPGCRRICGYGADAFLKDPQLLARIIHPDDLKRWQAHLVKPETERQAESAPLLRIRHRDGSERCLENEFRSVVSDDGRLLGTRGVFRDVTERREIEQSVQELTNMLVDAERIAGAGAWSWQSSDRLFHVSPGWQRIHGADKSVFTEEELLEHYAYPDDIKRIQSSLEKAKSGIKPYDIEHRIRRADDGTSRWVRVRAEIIRDENGDLKALRGIAIDITAEIDATRKLNDSEALLLATGRLARVGGWELDLSNNELLWTEITREMHEVLPKYKPTLERALSFFDEADRTRIKQAVDACKTIALPFELEARFTTAKGKRLWIKMSGEPVLEAGKLKRLRGTCQDITAFVSATRALRESEERYRALFESAAEGMLVLQRERFSAVNATALRMLGYEDAQSVLEKHPCDISPAVQPDGEDSHSKATRLIEWSTSTTRRFEWMHERADGTPLPVEVTLMPLTLAGEPALFVTWHDLTAETKARQRELQAFTVFENTAEGIMVMDPERRILVVNRAFTEMTGFGEDEARGKTPSLISAERPDAAFYRAIWEALESTGFWRGEIWNRRKNGELYPALMTISAVRDDRGELTNFIGLFSDITNAKRSAEELYRLAHSDPLTGLPNRALLQARMEQSLQRAARDRNMLAVLFIDLDLFKNVNDSLGHPAGDALLQQAAQAMQQDVREPDTLARLGGDEFVVLLDEIDDPNDAAHLAQRLLGALSRPFFVDGRELWTTASIGISVYPMDGRDIDALLSNADRAMYDVKEQGRNSYRFFEPQMTEGAIARLHLENALRGALRHGELWLAYQPQFSLDDLRLSGAEALLRWTHPEHGPVPPTEFIRIAEEIGMINTFGAWVLEQACRQLLVWDTQGFRLKRLAVNLSVQQLERADLIDQVRGILNASGVDPGRLELEVTESVLMRNVERVLSNLDQLRALGITLAVDDFGSGFSSLSYLKQLPISRLKIDKAFVVGVTQNADDDAIARAIIALGRTMGLDVIAEGVETRAQLRFLAGEGCREAQGFLLGRPMSAKALCEMARGFATAHV